MELNDLQVLDLKEVIQEAMYLADEHEFFILEHRLQEWLTILDKQAN